MQRGSYAKCNRSPNEYGDWERGTNENTTGLVRQYVPNRISLAHLAQQDCTCVACPLNHRPRKRPDHRTPEECYAG